MGITNTAAVSNEILPIYAVEAILQAQANFVFRRFVDYKFQASRQAGDTMRFWKRSNIGGGGALGEAEPVPTQSLSSTTVDVVMTEYGNSVALTRKAAETDIFDLIFHASLQLGRNYSLILDSAIRDTYLATANEQYAGGAASEATSRASSARSSRPVLASGPSGRCPWRSHERERDPGEDPRGAGARA